MALAGTSLNQGAVVAAHSPSRCPDPAWKLYYNPHYLPRGVSCWWCPSRSSSCRKNCMIVADYFDDDEGGGGGGIGMERDEEERYGGGRVVSASSDQELSVEELRAELEFERRMRRKVEALNEALAADLAEERRRGGAAEAECARMRAEADIMRAEMERALDTIGEERQLLRVAEMWREERVKIKLADARATVEEIAHAVVANAEGGRKSSGPFGKSSPVCPQSLACQQGSASGSGKHGQSSHRRDAAGGGENPHIKRGIKGFVEFPRGVRVRPREERVDLVSNLECQRAQLRVLMRHRRSPAVGMAVVGSSKHLVV